MPKKNTPKKKPKQAMIQLELFGDDRDSVESSGETSNQPMTTAEYRETFIALIIADLKTMPALWETEAGARNAWDMLVQMWPENEPGLGVWDEIQSVVRAWISGVLEKQPCNPLRELWEAMTDEGGDFDVARCEAEEKGEEAIYPGLEEISADLAFPFLSEVLSEAEREGDRRREEV